MTAIALALAVAAGLSGAVQAAVMGELGERVGVFPALAFSGVVAVILGFVALRARGPSFVIIKKGEHGAFMFTEKSVFFAPAYPLEDVFDPTGAGDSFAGGFMGYLARTGRIDDDNLRRAVVYGSAMGSFAVERFSIQRLMELTTADIRSRLVEFRRLVAFEEELPE